MRIWMHSCTTWDNRVSVFRNPTSEPWHTISVIQSGSDTRSFPFALSAAAKCSAAASSAAAMASVSVPDKWLSPSSCTEHLLRASTFSLFEWGVRAQERGAGHRAERGGLMKGGASE